MSRPSHSHTLSSSSLATSANTTSSSYWGGGAGVGGGGGGEGSTLSLAYSSTTTLPPGSALSSASSPRKKLVVGGQVSRRVGMFSPMLEEDETGTFGSPIKDQHEFRARERAAGGSAVSSPISLKSGGVGVRKKAAAFEGGPSADVREGGGGRTYTLGGGGELDSSSSRPSSPHESTQPLKLKPKRPLPSSPSHPPTPPVSRFISPHSPASASPTTPTRPARPPSLDFNRSSPATTSNPYDTQSTPTTSPTKQHLSYTQSSNTPHRSALKMPSALASPSKQPTLGSPSTTTRALITRFETPLYTPHRPTNQPQDTPRTPSRQHLDKPLPSPGGRGGGAGSSPLNTSPGGGTGKGKSPLKDGLKKLVGKFGGGKLMGRRRRKKSGGGWESGTDDEGLGGGSYGGGTWRAQEEPEPGSVKESVEIPRRSADRSRAAEVSHQSPTELTYTLSPVVALPTSSFPAASTKPIRTGPLFFYSSSSKPPHWLRTTASLFPGTLVLSSSSLRGESNSRSISLRACQVVRSVPDREARERWVSPLDGGQEEDEEDDDEVHYLELGFGGQSEDVVVAVLTVGERLGWVSSIWDAILGASNPLSPPPQEANNPTFSNQPPLDASPIDSLLDTPPVDPHALTLEGSYGLHQQGSLYVTNSDEDHNPEAAPQPHPQSLHVRQSSADDGPPRLSRPKLGGNVDEIRLSVERMFGAQLFDGDLMGGFPRGQEEVLQSSLSTMSARTEQSTSTGLSKAERMEDPSPLKPMGELGLASRLRNQSHHQGGEGGQYFGSRPIDIATAARTRSDSVGSLGGGAMMSPNDGPSPSMVHSETPSFDISDLNPSRSASQIQRRPPPKADGASMMTGYTFHQRRQQERFELPSPSNPEEQFEDLTTPRTSVFQTDPSSSSHPKALDPASTTSPATTLLYSQPTPVVSAPADLTPIISMLSSGEANSATRAQSFDLKLSIVQQGVAQLLERNSALSDEQEKQRMERLEMSLQGLGVDLREVVDGLRLKTISPPAMPAPLSQLAELKEGGEGAEEEKKMLEEVNGKLDGMLEMFEKLARGEGGVVVASKEGEAGERLERSGPPPVIPIEGIPGGSRFVVKPAGGEEKEEGEVDEKAPVAEFGATAASTAPLSLPVAAELIEVLTLVKEQQAQRSVQTQQTSDIARYLNELNSWMEQFVKNGNSALEVVSSKVEHLTDLIAPPPPATPQLGEAPAPLQPGIFGLLWEVRGLAMELRDHSVAAEQGGGPGGVGEAVQQRLEDVLAVMEQDRQRYQTQNSTIDGLMVMINQHKMENEQLLRAVALDLSREIQGERLRFVDAMSQATTVNVNLHVEEFKKLLSQEVARSMHDLGRIREEKKHLEQQIAELFATKVKFSSDGTPLLGGRPTSQQLQPRRPSQPLASPHPPPQAPLPPVPGQQQHYGQLQQQQQRF